MRDKRFVGEADHYDMDWVFDKTGENCNRIKELEARVDSIQGLLSAYTPILLVMQDSATEVHDVLVALQDDIKNIEKILEESRIKSSDGRVWAL